MKRIHIILTIFICILTLQFTVLQTHAYTDEEKQAVKNWLSANGYPPTMGGAEQAYQDYLNGKWDANGNPVTPTEPATEVPDEPDSEKKQKDNKSPNKKTQKNNNNKNDRESDKVNLETDNGAAAFGKRILKPEEILAALPTEEQESGESAGGSAETEGTAQTITEKSETTGGNRNDSPNIAAQNKKQTRFMKIVPIIIGPAAILFIGIIFFAVRFKSK